MRTFVTIAAGSAKKWVLSVSFIFLSVVVMAQSSKKKHAHIGLIYPISSNGIKADEYTNSLSFHVLAGLSKAETGLAAAGITLIIKDSARGVQLAGFSNHVLNRAGGVQLAGFLNSVKNEMKGFQGSGYLNIAGSVQGAQVAGFANYSNGNAGTQVGGFLNMAGNANNQVAGFMNLAKKVKGVQVAAFLNIADSSEYPIGIVNIIRNGEKSISVSVDETATTLVSFRSGSKRLYGILGIGYNFKSEDRLYALEAGIGAHFQVSPNFRINTEAVTVSLDDFRKGHYFKAALRVFPSFAFGRRFELFAGPTFNYAHFSNQKGKDLTDHYLWSETVGNNEFHGIFIGAIGGLQYKF